MTGPTDQKPSRGVTPLLVFVALALVLTALVLLGEPRQQEQKSEPITIGAPITLADQYGRSGGGDAMTGKFLLITFGYTFCPDVCPTILRDMSAAVDLLGEEGEKVVPVFVTVDPERDTAERMKDYAAHFHPRLLAFTGTPEEIAATAGDFHIYYARSQVEIGPEDYLMDHTALVFLMAPDGSYITHFPYGITPENMMIVMEQHL
jgi:protein SCO1/2